MDILSFVLGVQKGKASSGGGSSVEPEVTVLFETTMIGPFADSGDTHPTTNAALYGFETEQAPVSIEKGETYIVDWDGTQYTVVCKETSVDGASSKFLYLGDGAMWSASGISAEPSNEPFSILHVTNDGQSAVMFITTSTAVTHDFGLSLVEMPSVAVEPLTVTENGTYTAPMGTAYSPVTVNVAGGGGGTNWVSAYGEVAGTGADLVIEHNLGVIPDIIYYVVSPVPTGDESMPMYQIGFSRAMMDGFGEGFEEQGGHYILKMGAASIWNTTNKLPLDELTSSAAVFGGFCNVNETTFTIKYYSTIPITTAKTVKWYAVGGITG